MDSPATRAPPASSPSHPLTPPADPSPPQPTAANSQQQQPSSNSQTTTNTAAGAATNPTQIEALLSQPLTSATDSGAAKRPRDHRLIHLLLASHGIAAYQERVPLQLMDFAYRYTSSVLSDAVHVQAEGYDNPSSQTDNRGGRGRGGAAGGRGGAAGVGGPAAAAAAAAAAAVDEGDVGLSALRMAIASRMSYQFQGSLPKEFLKGLAEERNRIGLGVGLREQGTVVGGVRLPSEKYCLTGVGWGLKEEWDSEGEEEVEGDGDGGVLGGDVEMELVDGEGGLDEGEEEEDGDGGEDGGGVMEDVFGEDPADGDGGGGDGGGEDEEMRES